MFSVWSTAGYFPWQSELPWTCCQRDWGRLGLSCASFWVIKSPGKAHSRGWIQYSLRNPAESPEWGTQVLRAVCRVPLYICKRFRPCLKSLHCNKAWDAAISVPDLHQYSFDDILGLQNWMLWYKTSTRRSAKIDFMYTLCSTVQHLH